MFEKPPEQSIAVGVQEPARCLNAFVVGSSSDLHVWVLHYPPRLRQEPPRQSCISLLKKYEHTHTYIHERTPSTRVNS